MTSIIISVVETALISNSADGGSIFYFSLDFGNQTYDQSYILHHPREAVNSIQRQMTL